MKELSVQHPHQEFSQSELQLITATVAKGATEDELRLFLVRCKLMDLNPLKPGQIHFIKYGSSPGTIVVGIDGFRSRAASTNKHAGTKRGVLRDENGKCIGAWCEVYRTDWKEPARDEVSLAEYNTGKGPWAKMPETMIKKVAEAATLRMAFPDQLGGVYSDDEMAQANPAAIERPVTGQEIEPLDEPFDDSDDIGNFVLTIGQNKGKRLKDVDVYALENLRKYLIDNKNSLYASVKQRAPSEIQAISAYLETRDISERVPV